jgi:hypothetical protein
VYIRAAVSPYPSNLEKKTVETGTLFIIEKPFHERGKWLFAIYCISCISTALFCLVLILKTGADIKSLILIGIAIIASFIVGYRYAASASRIETVLVDDNTLTITKGNWFGKKHQPYQRDKIAGLRYVPKPVLTDHPLAGKSFDYLGFQTQQKVINEMFGDNKIAFQYEGQTISFGKDLYSWDFEELNSTINHPEKDTIQLVES